MCAGRVVEEEGREGGKKSDDETKNKKNDYERTQDRDEGLYVKRREKDEDDREGESIG